MLADVTVPIESIKTTSMENVSTGVLDKNKEHYLRCKRWSRKIIWCNKTYNWVCQNTKKRRFTVDYVKPTAQLLFKRQFPKVDKHTGGTWLIHDTKRRMITSATCKPAGPVPCLLATCLLTCMLIGANVMRMNSINGKAHFMLMTHLLSIETLRSLMKNK